MVSKVSNISHDILSKNNLENIGRVFKQTVVQCIEGNEINIMTKKVNNPISIFQFFLLAILLGSHSPVIGQSIKVFILAGQSNAEGHGEVEPASIEGTLAHFFDNGGDQEFGSLQDANGDWSVRNDVWVRYDHEFEDLITGELTVGYGYSQNLIGPEFGMGNVLGDYYPNDKVLIIKTCWGGRSLAEDFRPPSSGGTVGPYYTQMLADINLAINNIATEFPDYNNEPIEIAGLVWFQGFNDSLEQWMMDEYEQNLINLIADVRNDLNTSDLPVVVGLTGNLGPVVQLYGSDLQTMIVPAQINAANYTGHSDVCYADTRSFWRNAGESPEPDFGHHWHNNAESYLRIGNEFGQQMVGLLNDNCSNAATPTVYEASAYGFNYFYKDDVPDANFGAGFSFYSAVWPFMEAYPGNINYQTGQGTWLWPQLGDDEQLPDEYYNTIEGGLGWWGDTRFGTEVPKFIMGGVANSFDAFANGPGAGSTDIREDGDRDWSIPGGKYGAVQLSQHVLWPPDGLNMDQSMNGEFLGYGYHPLPLTDPLTTTNGVDFETGNQCWTLFMNTSNFKGPIAFFMPTHWTSVVLDDPDTYEGLFLDSRPSNPNMSFAQEFSSAPSVIGIDDNGGIFNKILPPIYPKTTGNTSELLRDVSVYSRDAMWNAVENWFNGGSVASTQLQPMGTIAVDFDLDNTDPPQLDGGMWNGAGPEIDAMLKQDDYGYIKMTPDEKAVYLEWNSTFINDIGSGLQMPEYYQLNNDNEWEVVPESAVPASTGLLDIDPLTNPIDDRPYLTPLEEDCHFFGQDSPWTTVGPSAGPFTAQLGDGSQVTYHWYKFIDQPAVIHANLPEAMRQDLQARVELIHTHWQSTEDYLPNPTGGALASLDNGLLVTPPAGLEIGYVPIVSRQEYAGDNTTSPTVDADLNVESNCIQLNPNPTSGLFTIQGNFYDYTIQVISQNGTIHQDLTGNPSPISIDIGALPAGIYFIRVHNTQTNELSLEKILKF